MKRLVVLALVALGLSACVDNGPQPGNPTTNFLQDDGYENLPPS